MRPFTYLTPRTLDEAISLHQSHGEQARYVAGGTDVLVKIKEGKLAPNYLISLKHIIGQDSPFLNHETGELYIGAFCTHRSIEKSTLVQRHYPIIHDAVKNIGSLQIRNVATIGGNLVNAVPSADGAIPLIVLDAKANIYGTKGQRSIDLRRFFLGPGQCDPEKYLKGKTVDEIHLSEAGTLAGQESKVRDSIRGVAWYRREMVGVLVKRMGLKALERAKEKQE